MTDDIDTAAIRAKLNTHGDPGIFWFNETCYALVDALDAARAELDDLRRDTHSMSGAGNMDHWCARAEAAEARIAELESQPRGINREEALLWRDERDDLLGWYQQARKERDEATVRIAAALDQLDDCGCIRQWRCSACRVRRALTGDTE